MKKRIKPLKVDKLRYSLSVRTTLLLLNLMLASISLVNPRGAALNQTGYDQHESLEEAFKITLLNLYKGPEFVNLNTGIPYESISLTERKGLSQFGSGGDVCEMFTPFWIYYIATQDEDVGEIISIVTESMIANYDPGTGLIGSHIYDMSSNILHEYTGSQRYGYWSDAEHGGEALMYSIFPYAWFFKSKSAIQCLERYARTMLSINNETGYVHFHLYIGLEPNGKWKFLDFDGERRMVPPDPQAYSDMMEFWWILPLLEAALVTENQTLREQIISRVRRVMDNIIELQNETTGQVPTVFKMDGSFGMLHNNYFGWTVGMYDYQNWIRASYFIHHLTGDSKYIRVLDRFWDWYFSYPGFPVNFHQRYDNSLGVPIGPGGLSALNPLSQYVFHAYYTGNMKHMDKVMEWVDTLPSTGDGVSFMLAKALAYIVTGDRSYLEVALSAEKSYRKNHFFNIAGYRYYLEDSEVAASHKAESDFFRGRIANLILAKNFGDETYGLIGWNGRDLLALGWLVPAFNELAKREPYDTAEPTARIYISWLKGDLPRFRGIIGKNPFSHLVHHLITRSLIDSAENALKEAEKSYNNGHYVDAKNHVISAYELLREYKERTIYYTDILMKLIISISGVCIILFLWRLRSRISKILEELRDFLLKYGEI
ncbi:hypothetical protein DRO55_06755 [Candidatus Bathyarchaeota archaeon]|nr:MAG: hypothetical protein DRO55_06755 [Candidatus Bathyarchaeota archaeon]